MVELITALASDKLCIQSAGKALLPVFRRLSPRFITHFYAKDRAAQEKKNISYDLRKTIAQDLAPYLAERCRSSLKEHPERWELAIQGEIEELLRQADNKEAVAEQMFISLEKKSPEELKNMKEPDPDWLKMFLEFAQRATSEDARELWGKILAGELVNPGGISRRALDALSKLAPREAELFKKWMPLIGESGFIYCDRLTLGEDFRVLKEAGLIDEGHTWNLGELTAQKALPPKEGIEIILPERDGINCSVWVNKTLDKRIPVDLELVGLSLTQVAKEFRKILLPQQNFDALKAEEFLRRQFKFKLTEALGFNKYAGGKVFSLT